MLEIWKNHEDQNQRPSSAALNSLSLVLQTWVFQRASDPSDPYTSIHGLGQFFTILTSADHTIKKLYYLAYLMACFVQILKMTFRKKTFLYFVISYVSYFTMACAFNYGFVALKFTMDGRDRKKIEKKLTARDLWSANFNLTNTLGFAKQYIYQILHNITERYLIINRNLYFYKQTTNVSLTTLSVTYDWL